MAEEFSPYHVPQQSRREKLRENTQQGCLRNLQDYQPVLPLYDPQLISPDFIGSAAYHHRLTADAGDGVKVEGINFTGFVGGTSTSHLYVHPQVTVQLSPSTVQDYDGDANGSTAFAYPAPPCYRALLDHSYLAHQEANNAGAAMMSGQSLSLSLSSHHSNLPLELNLQRYDSSIFSSNEKVSEAGGEGYNLAACSGVSGSGSGTGSASIELTKSTVPLGPFTGYASILKGSRFLKPAQQLLEEICDVGRGILAEINGAGDSGLLEPSPLQSLSENGMIMDESVNCSDGGEQTRNKSRLISMLDEIYRRYKQYYHQMHSAVAAFESVAGLSGAAPFANLALKAMSKHFRILKDAIMEQLQLSNKLHGKMNRGRDENQSHDRSGKGTSGQRAFHAQGFSDPPIWRPQRGLPERAVTVLRAWLFEHFLHPYPTDADKIMLAKQTGLSRNQVSNWFINARVRLWKPMVEEIHTLETRQAQKASHRVQLQEQSPSSHNDHVQSNCSNDPENTASISVQRMGDFNLKRPRISSDESPKETEELMKLQYDTSLFHNNSHMGAAGVGNAGGVSLTLGLHQNGMGLSDAYGPINAARRLGLDSHGEGYMVGGFELQTRQYGRGGGGMMGGQLMHDFVG